MIATDYQQQALDFLKETDTTFEVRKADHQTCPNWGPCKPFIYRQGRQGAELPHNHGFKYIATFKRGSKVFSLDFWSSIEDTYGKTAKDYITDRGCGKIRDPTGYRVVKPTAYDILACISGDVGAQDQTFEEWASNTGYDTDSIKAKSIYEAVCDQSRQLARIWTTEELEKLQEIS